MPENEGEGPRCSNGSGARVVSMPDYIRSHLRFSVELHESTSGDPFGSCSEELEQYRSPTDVPRTPSPPSSSESFLFVGSSARLSEDFTRGIVSVSSHSLTEEAEGWMAWASSPPRPIPALHGPPSLPYARCPSGAEGTIIEEPGDVSRMIWGLDSDDQPPIHPRLLERDRFGRAEPLMPQLPSPRSSQMQKKANITSQRHLSLRSSARKNGELSDKKSRPWPLHTAHKQSTSVLQAPTHQSSIETKHHHGDQSFNAVSNYYSCDDEASPTTDATFSRLTSVPRSLENFNTDPGERPHIPQDSRLVVASSALHGFLRTAPHIFVEPRLNEPNSQALNGFTMDTVQSSHQHLRQRGQRIREVLQVPATSNPTSSLRPSYVPSAVPLPSDAGLGDIHLKIPILSTKSSSQPQPHQHSREHHGNVDNRKHLDMRGPSLPQNPDNEPLASVRRHTTSPNTLADYFTQMQMQNLHTDIRRPVPPSASTVPTPFHPTAYGTNDVGVSLTVAQRAVAVPTITPPDSTQSPAHNFPCDKHNGGAHRSFRVALPLASTRGTEQPTRRNLLMETSQ
ncbi:hypothetical protein EDC04DRAFT_2876844 [Pisolithus marmoratus]|nr:hypothetical protein EDC04DRAFT_2876844 [Pisolithus marmoratus]